jgi:hypothetical protein
MESTKRDWAQGYVLRGSEQDGEAIRYWPDALTDPRTGEVYLASGERDDEYPDLERFDLQVEVAPTRRGVRDGQ